MGGPTTITALALVATLLVAGCIGPQEPGVESAATNGQESTQNSSQESTTTFSGNVGGQESKSRKVTVENGATKLTVTASWSVGGQASFKLKDPTGRVVEQDNLNGGNSRGGGVWYEADNPRAGDWILETFVNGGGSYRFVFTR